jgi:PTH1 family peptidyl-tRNA hydrolase
VARIGLIVGLGNPGTEHEATRHNAGFWFVDELAAHQHAAFRAETKFFGQVARVNLATQDVWLLKPTTYMNRSGQAVSALASYYKIDAENILVVHDELDLPVGNARLKQGGGHGGHNGLRDIASALGTKNFLRLRIGIAHPGDSKQVTNYVLGRPSTQDRHAIEDAIRDAIDVMPLVVGGDRDRAMNILNPKK